MTKAASLETIRRYNAGEITERQACDWFGVDRLTFRAALAASGDAPREGSYEQGWDDAILLMRAGVEVALSSESHPTKERTE